MSDDPNVFLKDKDVNNLAEHFRKAFKLR